MSSPCFWLPSTVGILIFSWIRQENKLQAARGYNNTVVAVAVVLVQQFLRVTQGEVHPVLHEIGGHFTFPQSIGLLPISTPAANLFPAFTPSLGVKSQRMGGRCLLDLLMCCPSFVPGQFGHFASYLSFHSPNVHHPSSVLFSSLLLLIDFSCVYVVKANLFTVHPSFAP